MWRARSSIPFKDKLLGILNRGVFISKEEQWKVISRVYFLKGYELPKIGIRYYII